MPYEKMLVLKFRVCKLVTFVLEDGEELIALKPIELNYGPSYKKVFEDQEEAEYYLSTTTNIDINGEYIILPFQVLRY